MIKKTLLIVLILTSSVILGHMLHQGYMIIGIDSWHEGCIEASLRLRNDFGQTHEKYMKDFCDYRNITLKKEFGIQE